MTKPQAFQFTANKEFILPIEYDSGEMTFDILYKHNPKGYPNGDKYMVLIIEHDKYDKKRMTEEGFNLIGLAKGEDITDVYHQIMMANMEYVEVNI